MNTLGQQILTMFCTDEVRLFFTEKSLVNYTRAHMVCPQVRTYTRQKIDITIDLEEGFISVKGKSFSIDKIGEDAYNQGIHEYYL
ncbi:MAG: hypothetical protein GF334_01430 [Candidatus Altiarchaeales archaeon]|nr:hypothetical protein [Candidatus Altiarchaeales archaeon]